MKFKKFICVFISTLFLSGCSSSPDELETTTEMTTKTTTETTTEITSIASAETTTEPFETTEVITIQPEIVTTPLYNDIFLKFSDGIGTTLFYGALEVVEKSGYKYDVTEPTDEVLGSIHIYGDDGGYVYITSYPKSDIEMLFCVGYVKDSKEIYITNEFHTVPTEYHTHILRGERMKVSNINELEKFMFSN